jgi:hypothetical protein
MTDPELVALFIKTICALQMHAADDHVLHPLPIPTTRKGPHGCHATVLWWCPHFGGSSSSKGQAASLPLLNLI